MTYYKVIATVNKVSKPSSYVTGEKSHVVLPCRMYKEGDRIVFEDNQINMAETTGALCLSLVASLIPVLKCMQRSVEPLKDEKGSTVSDSTQKVTWFSCSDAERPVILRIDRVPLKRKPGWVIAEKLVESGFDEALHLHAPNLYDKQHGIDDNIWEKIIIDDKIEEM